MGPFAALFSAAGALGKFAKNVQSKWAWRERRVHNALLGVLGGGTGAGS